MKLLLIIPLLFFYMTATAQVPPRTGGDIGDDIVIPGPSRSENARNNGAGYYQKDGKFGFVDPKGVKLDAIYNKIISSSNGFIIQKGDLYGMANKNGEVIVKIEYDSIGNNYGNNYVVKKKGKYGTLSNEGSKILSVKYDKILSAGNVVSFVQSGNGDVQLIFNEQEKAFPKKIDYAVLYSDLVIVKANGKFGVVKKEVVIPFEYDSIFVSSIKVDNYASKAKKAVKWDTPVDRTRSYMAAPLLIVQKDNKYGLMDNNGAIVYPADNDAVDNQESLKYCTVRKGNLYGIYFTQSRKKTGIDFQKVYADGYGYVMATKNQQSGVFDLNGNEIVPFQYDPEFIAQYSQLGFRVTKNKKRGIVSKTGVVIVPPIYDNVDPFYETGLAECIKVQSDGKTGIVNLKGEVIVPVKFEWIGAEQGFFKVVTTDRKFGLYDQTGKVVVPAMYQYVTKSDTEGSNIIILTTEDHTHNFISKNTRQALLKENVVDYGYIEDEDGLLNPFTSIRKYFLFVKGTNGKYGVLNEVTGTLDIPMIYDEIMQRFEGTKTVYFSVRSGKKYGLIDDRNKEIIPLQYDAINIDFMQPDNNGKPVFIYSVIVAKGNKFGTVDLDNKVQIPLQYNDLQRISGTGLYKAKVGSQYRLIDKKNQLLNKGPFDEIANFEKADGINNSNERKYEALTFYKGKMRVIDDKGTFKTTEVAMQPHNGYTTFDELKNALVKAFDSKDDLLLKDFAAKIAPSEHILYYLKDNPFGKQELRSVDINSIKERYYNDLLNFKLSNWNEGSGRKYNRSSLTAVTDYTLYDRGFITNKRNMDHAFGDTRLMEKILRNSFKINGYWISSYFMNRNFERGSR